MWLGWERRVVRRKRKHVTSRCWSQKWGEWKLSNMAQKIMSSDEMKIEHFCSEAKYYLWIEQSSSPVSHLPGTRTKKITESSQWKSLSGVAETNPIETLQNNLQSAVHNPSPFDLVEHELAREMMKYLNTAEEGTQVVHSLFKSFYRFYSYLWL